MLYLDLCLDFCFRWKYRETHFLKNVPLTKHKHKSEFMFFLSKLAFPFMYLNSVNGTMIHLVDWDWNTGFIWVVHHLSCLLNDSKTLLQQFSLLTLLHLNFFIIHFITLIGTKAWFFFIFYWKEAFLLTALPCFRYHSITLLPIAINLLERIIYLSWHEFFSSQHLLTLSPFTCSWFLLLYCYFQIYCWFLSIMLIAFIFISLIKYNSHAIRDTFSGYVV